MQKTTGTLTVGHLLKTAAVRYREKEALYCTSTNRRYTFGQLNARVNGLANGLLGLGLHKGDTAAFLCNNRVEIVELFLALAKIRRAWYSFELSSQRSRNCRSGTVLRGESVPLRSEF